MVRKGVSLVGKAVYPKEEDEPFSFSPVDRIPTLKRQPGNYSNVAVEAWGWMDFYDYFEDSYLDAKNAEPIRLSNRAKGKWKTAIEKSYNFWGKETFRVMIDWMFDNAKDYPEWKSLDFSLLCGCHNWAKMIGEQAQKRIEFGKN